MFSEKRTTWTWSEEGSECRSTPTSILDAMHFVSFGALYCNVSRLLDYKRKKASCNNLFRFKWNKEAFLLLVLTVFKNWHGGLGGSSCSSLYFLLFFVLYYLWFFFYYSKLLCTKFWLLKVCDHITNTRKPNINIIIN